MFSEFYFYLTGYIVRDDGDDNINKVEKNMYPTIYRIDRMLDFMVTDEHFRIP